MMWETENPPIQPLAEPTGLFRWEKFYLRDMTFLAAAAMSAAVRW